MPLPVLADRLMNSDLTPTDDAAEASQELRSLLKPMLIEQLKAEQTPDLAAHNPGRYREIQERIKNLASPAAAA